MRVFFPFFFFKLCIYLFIIYTYDYRREMMYVVFNYYANTKSSSVHSSLASPWSFFKFLFLLEKKILVKIRRDGGREGGGVGQKEKVD